MGNLTNISRYDDSPFGFQIELHLVLWWSNEFSFLFSIAKKIRNSSCLHNRFLCGMTTCFCYIVFLSSYSDFLTALKKKKYRFFLNHPNDLLFIFCVFNKCHGMSTKCVCVLSTLSKYLKNVWSEKRKCTSFSWRGYCRIEEKKSLH